MKKEKTNEEKKRVFVCNYRSGMIKGIVKGTWKEWREHEEERE